MTYAHRIAIESQHVPVTTSVSAGYPATVIAARAGTIGADLIVMGTHGRSGVSHLLMGSVAERVMRTAPCPVLTVRDAAKPNSTSATRAA